MPEIIQFEDKYYIAVNSSYADNRVKVLNYGDTFGIFDRRGDIKMLGEKIQGIYHNGTRYINDLELRINGLRPLLLSSSVKEQNEILTIDLTNPPIKNSYSSFIPKDTLYLGRSKFLMDGVCYEQIRLSNYGIQEYTFQLKLSISADFKDIFEVRGIKRARSGEIYEIAHGPDHSIQICYIGLDKIKRITHASFSMAPTGWDKFNEPLFQITLGPNQKINFDYTLRFQEGNKINKTIGYAQGRQKLEKDIRKHAYGFPQIHTSHEKFNSWIQRSRFDLSSLLSRTRMGNYPYAGVPWYNTAFGRDGIITALQTLWVVPKIARDVVLYLSKMQAEKLDRFRDAEPGKIIHEVRGGEMAALGEIPFERYYGSVDSTPLYVVLVGQYIRRTDHLAMHQKVWKNVKAAIQWIEDYGDLDGDGLIEYAPGDDGGLSNQGWKDSFDSIFDADGRMTKPPIALCEVQGYVYQAYQEGAYLAQRMKETTLSRLWSQKAVKLKQQFNQSFWDPENKTYVIALDKDKVPSRVLNSNAGHALYSGIADKDKAAVLAETLMSDTMFSGWGIRTIGKGQPRYNPMSYHNGSIWPHDVAIICAGMARYGYSQNVEKLTMCMFEASQQFEHQRLPELFCGFDRRRGEGPTNYPVACSPQAWAVGALYMMLEACLQMKIQADEKILSFHKPNLPKEIDTLEITGLKLGNNEVNLFINRLGFESVSIDCKALPRGWKLVVE